MIAAFTKDEPLILVPPPDHWRKNRGFRHVALAGAETTLCGRQCDGWQGEFRGFEARTIGCKVCARIWERTEKKP